eukprot:4294648-Prymnesium_polylepis.1
MLVDVFACCSRSGFSFCKKVASLIYDDQYQQDRATASLHGLRSRLPDPRPREAVRLRAPGSRS